MIGSLHSVEKQIVISYSGGNEERKEQLSDMK